MNPVTVPSTTSGQTSRLDQENLLRRITNRIRRSLELQEILNATVTEVQQFLGVDRLKIYKFHADTSGQVIAESLGEDRRLPPLNGLNFPADDIPPHARQLFIEAKVRNVVNVDSGLIGQSRLCDPETGEVIAEDWAFRPLDPCHQEYLTAMGIKASVTAPIFHHDQLWGLLVAHHATPLEIPLQQLRGIQLVVDQISVAIAQSTHLQYAQAKVERKAILNKIAAQLNSLTAIDLQAALESTVQALQAIVVAYGSDPRSYNCSMALGPTVTPRFIPLENSPIWRAYTWSILSNAMAFKRILPGAMICGRSTISTKSVICAQSRPLSGPPRFVAF